MNMPLSNTVAISHCKLSYHTNAARLRDFHSFISLCAGNRFVWLLLVHCDWNTQVHSTSQEHIWSAIELISLGKIFSFRTRHGDCRTPLYSSLLSKRVNLSGCLLMVHSLQLLCTYTATHHHTYRFDSSAHTLRCVWFDLFLRHRQWPEAMQKNSILWYWMGRYANANAALEKNSSQTKWRYERNSW